MLGRICVVLGIVTVGLTAGHLRVPGAQAEIGVCYTDPVVVLSNGTTVDLNDTINDSYLDVQHIVYTLHAPVGTSIESVTYTSGPIGPKESLQYYADQPAGQYTATSDVFTGASNIAVTANGTAASPTAAVSDSVNGWNGQKIRVDLTP
jgi:hypothetical protein